MQIALGPQRPFSIMSIRAVSAVEACLFCRFGTQQQRAAANPNHAQVHGQT